MYLSPLSLYYKGFWNNDSKQFNEILKFYIVPTNINIM